MTPSGLYCHTWQISSRATEDFVQLFWSTPQSSVENPFPISNCLTFVTHRHQQSRHLASRCYCHICHQDIVNSWLCQFRCLEISMFSVFFYFLLLLPSAVTSSPSSFHWQPHMSKTKHHLHHVWQMRWRWYVFSHVAPFFGRHFHLSIAAAQVNHWVIKTGFLLLSGCCVAW